MEATSMKSVLILLGIFVTFFATITADASAPNEDVLRGGTAYESSPARRDTAPAPARSTRGRARQTRITAEIRLTADSRVRQTLVAINKDSQDGQWILASNAGVPLLDRWRGEETEAEGPSETTVRAIRKTAADAGIEATDTIVRILDRRIQRDPELRRHRAAGLLERDANGIWHVVGSPTEDEESVDQLFARMSAEAENADVRALTREVERQVCAAEEMESEVEYSAAGSSQGGSSPGGAPASCCSPKR
jgi:hypothetical protein